jgi:predicted O-methyltransferase YrrM
MLKKHHTLNYIKAKIRLLIFQKRRPNLPWLSLNSIDIIDQLIKTSDVGMEFGSGRSTAWLAGKCKNLTSIEHNKEWYTKVTQMTKHLGNIELLLLSATKDSSIPEYISPLHSKNDLSLDFILNDGKLRDLVALNAIAKLKNGGLLIIDNAERYLKNTFNLPESIGFKSMTTNWQKFDAEANHWRRIWVEDGVTSTLILIKD